MGEGEERGGGRGGGSMPIAKDTRFLVVDADSSTEGKTCLYLASNLLTIQIYWLPCRLEVILNYFCFANWNRDPTLCFF